MPGCIYLPEIWFPIEERNLAFGIPFYLNILGLNFGYSFPGIYYGASKAGCIDAVRQIQLICALLSTIILLIVCVLMKNRPRSNQNKNYMRIMKNPDMKRSFRNMFCNSNNLFNCSLLASFVGLSWSNFQRLGIFITDADDHSVSEPYSAFKIGLMSFIFNISGIIVGFMTSFWNMKAFNDGVKPKIDITLKTLLVVGYTGLLVLTALDHFKIYIYAVVTATLMRVFSTVVCCRCRLHRLHSFGLPVNRGKSVPKSRNSHIHCVFCVLQHFQPGIQWNRTALIWQLPRHGSGLSVLVAAHLLLHFVL